MVLWLVTYFFRPLLPVDETRYATVAWEMWNNGNFLVPHLNGQPYSDKPPLLFWLINLGWWLFGVNDWWARLVPVLFALGSLGLLVRLAGYMWPAEKTTAWIAPFIFVGSPGILFYSTALRFDMLMVFFVLATLIYLWRATMRAGAASWIGVGVMTGLGILAKGPVTLVYVLPPMLLAPWWLPVDRRMLSRRWYAGATLALLMTLVTIGLWLIPTLRIADADYLYDLLVTQTSGHIAGDPGRDRPIGFYLPWLFILTLPWIIWPPFWRGLANLLRGGHDPASRLLAFTVATNLLFFTLIGSKHAHYLLPDIAMITLLAAHAITTGAARVDNYAQRMIAIFYVLIGLFVSAISMGLSPPAWPDWTDDVPFLSGAVTVLAGVVLAGFKTSQAWKGALAVTATSIVAVLALTLGPIHTSRVVYDMRGISQLTASLQREDMPVAILGRYRGEFTYVGQLYEPVLALEVEQLSAWIWAYPDGFTIVQKSEYYPEWNNLAVYSQPYRSGGIWVFENRILLISQLVE